MQNHFYFSRWEYYAGKLKGLKKSGTIWFNSIIAAVAAALPYAISTFPQIKGYVPDNVYETTWVVLVVGNILFRFKTTKDLADK